MRAERPATRLLQWSQASLLVAYSRHWLWRGRRLLQAPVSVLSALATILNHQPRQENSQ